MVALGGLGYDLLLGRQMGSSGWHLGGIWRCLEDMGSYLEDPKSWEYAQWRVILVGSGGRKAYNLNDYKLTIYMLRRL